MTSDKRCGRCHQLKPVTEFNRNSRHKDGLASWCRPCNKANCAKWYYENWERKQASQIRNRYGLSWDDYGHILTAQNGVCAICGNECDKRSRLSIDHCHTTSIVRGLLCDDCNSGLGRFKDDPARLRNAITYLETPRSRTLGDT